MIRAYQTFLTDALIILSKAFLAHALRFSSSTYFS